MKRPVCGADIDTADAVSESGYSTEEDEGDERRDTLVLGGVFSKLNTAVVLARRARLVIQEMFSSVQFLYHTGMGDVCFFFRFVNECFRCYS
jgi:hypothetical protein